MPISLHPNCKRKMLELLVKFFPQIMVKNRQYLEKHSAGIAFLLAEQALPQGGKQGLMDQLVGYIDHFPVAGFFTDRIETDLKERFDYTSEPEQEALTAVDGYADIQRKSEQLIEELESLPWTYMLTMAMPKGLADSFAELSLDREAGTLMSIRSDRRQLEALFPINAQSPDRQFRIHGGLSLLAPRRGEANPKEWSAGPFFQFPATGYIDRYGTTIPVANVRFLLRSFIGLGMALNIFDFERKYSFYRDSIDTFVHRKVGEAWEIDGKLELDDLSSLNSVVLHDNFKKRESVERRVSLMNLFLNDFSTLTSSGEKGNRVLLASQWLFDGYAVRDELLRFVQTVVALEVLLGEEREKDRLGLGAMLRNRCAYLIAESHDDRESLMRDFEAIYDVRSKIVHRGLRSLTLDERGLFRKLRAICMRVIRREMFLITAKDS